MIRASLYTFVGCIFLTSSTDPCERVCQTFTASRMGNGFNLCDRITDSFCNPETQNCENLFWTRTESGDRGLFRSVPGAYAEEEFDTPLTCAEARSLDDNSIYASAVYILSHLRPLQSVLSRRGVLRDLFSGNPQERFYFSLYLHRMDSVSFDHMRDSLSRDQIDWSPFQVIHAAISDLDDFADSDIFSSVSLSVHREYTCRTCGNSEGTCFGVQRSLPSNNDDIPESSSHPLSVRDIINADLADRMIVCESCNQHTRLRRTTINRFERAVFIEIKRLVGDTFIDTPIIMDGLIQLRRTMSDGELEDVYYDLTGVVHRKSDGKYFVEYLHQERMWVTTEEDGQRLEELPVENRPANRQSTTATLLIYQRQ